MPNARFLTSASGAGGFPADEGREVAVAGRSNSGKSSAINTIVGRRGLARVGKTPGRTQLVNFFELDVHARLVDLPGYGFARVPDAVRERWRRLVEAYFDARTSLVGLFVTVDVRRGLTELDLELLEWTAGLGVARVLLLTKADKLGRGARSAQRANVLAAAPAGTQAILFSALDGTGGDEARELLAAWLAPPVGPVADARER